MTVDVHRRATAEMIEAARFYEGRSQGLGFRFIRAVEEVCASVGEFPEAGAPLGRKDRKRRLPGFPYEVVYRAREDAIVVLAITSALGRFDPPPLVKIDPALT